MFGFKKKEKRTVKAETMPEVEETIQTTELPSEIADLDAQIEEAKNQKLLAVNEQDFARAEELKVTISNLERTRSDILGEWEISAATAPDAIPEEAAAHLNYLDEAVEGEETIKLDDDEAARQVADLERRISELQKRKHAAILSEDYLQAAELREQEESLEEERAQVIKMSRVRAAETEARRAAERRAIAEAEAEAKRIREEQELADREALNQQLLAEMKADGTVEDEPKRGLFGRKKKSKSTPRVTYSFDRNEVTTQRILHFEEMYPDGIARIGENRYSQAIKFEDANYQSARRTEQLDILTEWAQILNSLDASVEAQIWLQSTRIGNDEIGNELQLHDVNGDAIGNEYRHEINALVSSKVNSNERSMRKQRAIILTTEAPSHEKAAKKLATNADRIHRFMNNLDVESSIMSGQERLDVINSLCNQDDPAGMATFKDLDCSPGLRTVDLVAPSKICRLNQADLLIGRRFVRSYIIRRYASTTRDDLISSLSQVSCDSVISMHARAWDQAQAIAFAEAHLDDVILENESYKSENTRPERGRFIDDENLPKHMREAKEEAERIRDGLVNQDQRMFALTFVVTVLGRTPEELTQACSEVEAVFSEQRIGADWYPEWREDAFSTSLPVGCNCLPYTRNMFTDPLAAYVPFTSVDLMDEGGIYLGINSDTHNHIIFDREREEAANGFILGMPGGGKSVQAKWTIIQTHLRFPDDDIIVIDPEREYLRMAYGIEDSQVVNISENSNDHINLFDISEYYGSEDAEKSSANPLPLKVNMLQAAFHMMASSITDEEMNVIDAACGHLYQRYLATLNDADLPTLQDFYEYLGRVEGATRGDAEHLATLIQRYVSGTFSVFNHPTNVDLSKHFIVFDVQDLGSQLKPLALLVILDHVWNRVTRNRAEGRRTWLFIDELQLLLDDEYAVDYFDTLWTRSRKWGLFCTGITQNITRLLENQKTSYMVENSHFLTLCKQSGKGARLLSDFLHLSDSQYRTLRTAAKGEGLYIFGQRKVIRYDNVIPQEICPKLYRMLTTKFKDIQRYNELVDSGERGEL